MTFQYPTHSGSGQPWFSSQPHVKVLNGGVENSNASSSTSGPGLGKACGKVAFLVLAGCTAAGTRTCAWCARIQHILEKHHSETCKLLHSSVILVMLTENRFLADFFFSLAVLNFALKIEEMGESSPSGRGTSRDICKLKCMHMSATPAVTSSLCFTTQHLIILNLHFSALSKVPRSIPFYISEMSQGDLQTKLMKGTNCCHQGKLQGYIQATDSGGSRLTPFSGANAILNSKLSTLRRNMG